METIKLFSKGDTVKVWQKFLNDSDPVAKPLKVDGSFGPATTARTLTWQRINDLKIDGIVGPKTWDVAMKLAAKLGIGLGLAVIGGVITGILNKKTPRELIVQAAKSQLGKQDPNKYWADVQPQLVNSNKAWCGGFALWALHKAEVAKNVIWQIGKGFTAINGLQPTRSPKPGDIVYIDQPFQHHAIVETFDPVTGALTTIDGNQAGGTVKIVPRNIKNVTAVYSIEPFLSKANA